MGSQPLPPDLNDPDLLDDPDRPSVLYHYTDGAGLFGILENGLKLRASHCRYLNDAGEIMFGAEVVRETFRRVEGVEDAVRAGVNRSLEQISEEDSYIACFSERYDVLSQWRAYGHNRTGYCIGLVVNEHLKGYGDDKDYWSEHLMKCDYGQEVVEQQFLRRAQLKVKRSRDYLECGKEDSVVSKWLERELTRTARRCIFSAKHKHFAEEMEWRIIVSAPERDVFVQRRGTRLVPTLMTDPLDLREVWIGPRVDPDSSTARCTVQKLLVGRQVKGASVEVWASPIAK